MNFREWMDDISNQNEKSWMNPESYVLYKYQELGLPTNEQDIDYVDVRHEHLQRQHMFAGKMNAWDENPDTFEYDNDKYPEAMKMYKKNYESYEDSKRYFEDKPSEYPSFRGQKWETDLNAEPWSRKY